MNAAAPAGLGDLEALAARAAEKRRATLAATLALRGFELRQQADGTWRIARWNLERPAASLDEVERIARQVGALL